MVTGRGSARAWSNGLRHRHPPSAARLLGFLRRLWKNSSRTGWVHFELKKFAAFSGLSERQVQRAKNHLQSSGAALFVTISNQRGVRGHQVYAGDPSVLEATSKTLMAWSVDGRERHRWDKIRGELHPLPCPSLGRKFQENRVEPSISCSRQPRDIFEVLHTREKSLQHSNTSLGQVSGLRSGPLLGGSSPPGLVWHPQRRETASERRLAWFVVRKISRLWWDNCKVLHPGQKMGGVFNLALRWIRRGLNISDIIKNFRISLEKMHGLCVDFQLMRDDPSLRFTIGSTITLTDRRLCSLFSSNQLAHWSSCVVVQA